MALTTEQRRENYRAQRQGGMLTAKQRKRIRKAANKAESTNAGLHVSRIRKAYDAQRRRTIRQEAQRLIFSIRSGHLRPKFQAQLRAEAAALQAQQRAATAAKYAAEQAETEAAE